MDAVTDSYDSKEVVLTWWDDEPIEIHTGKLQLPQFTMTDRKAQSCVEAYKTGSLNCYVLLVNLFYDFKGLQLHILFSRQDPPNV